MNHLTPEQMTGHLDGALDPRADAVVERHLAACVRCRVELASLASQDDRLRASLTHDPGEAYFETFADRVLERARTAAPEPEVALETVPRAREIAREPHRGFWDWLSPRGMAWAGSVAAVIAAAGLVFVTARERNVDHLRSPELIRRSEQAAPPVEATPASPEPNAPSEGAMNDRDAALKKLQALADQEAPAVGSRLGAGTGAKESERRDEASSTVERPLAGADGKSQSAPSRMVEVRRTPNGEEVPVRKGIAPGFATSPPAALTPSAAPTGAVTVTKPKPQPMSESANEKTKQETGAASLDKAASPPAVDARERRASANAAAPTPPSTSTERGQAFLYRKGAPAPTLQFQDALTQAAKDEVRRCGVVRDPRGHGLAGAQVAIADLGHVATTDSAGRFCISAPAGLHTVSAYGLRFAPLRQDATFGSGEGELVLVVEPVSVLPEQAKSVDSRAVLWPAAARTEASHALALEDSVARAPSAAAYERVAQSWQRVLDIVPSGSGTSDARDHLAEARFRAWETGPTVARAQAARAALDAYLVSAPAGARRTLAEQRRERLPH